MNDDRDEGGDETVPGTFARSFEDSLEAGWQGIRRGLAVAALAVILALVALLVVSAAVSPFDGERGVLVATLHIAARLWFVGVLYAGFITPVAHAALGARGGIRRAVGGLVIDRRYWRWLVAVGLGAPVVGFAALEPTAALLVVAVVIVAIIVLSMLGVSF